MALLKSPYWVAVSSNMHKLLAWIGKQPFAARFYLAGGTALALQLGHRRSMDLDFFSETDEVHAHTRQELIQAFSARNAQVIENVDGDLLLLVNGVHTGFFSYVYPLLEPVWVVENIGLASLLDIGLMKLDAIIGRGSRKDFYDLYMISQVISLNELLRAGERKYPQARDFQLMALEGLLQFDNADRDLQPKMLLDLSWDTVKLFFLEKGKELGKSWFTK
jgi:predicted nucleotidyltransferase component of viral defense system